MRFVRLENLSLCQERNGLNFYRPVDLNMVTFLEKEEH